MRLLILILFTSLAFGQTYKASVGGTPGGTPSSQTLPSLNTATGDFIVGAATCFGHHLTGVTDTAGNTYHLKAENTTASNAQSVTLFYAYNATSNASNVLTLTYDASCAGMRGVASEFSSVQTSSDPTDQYATGGTNSPSTPLVTSSFTTTTANQGIWSAVMLANDRSSSAITAGSTPSPGYTLAVNSSNDTTTSSGLWSEYLTVTSIKTGITASFGNSFGGGTIDAYNINAITFKSSIVTTTSITSIEPTATQAIIRVKTGQSGACTYRASQGRTLGTLGVNDVNTSIFASSNSDARFGSVVSGNIHTFVLGTRPSQAISMKGSDGNFYSRALLANTLHTVGVTCGSDAEVTAVFSTLNPPLGSPGPDWSFPFDTTGFGNEGWPTIFWNCLQWANPQSVLSQTDVCGEDQKIIDPQTGLLLRRADGPGGQGNLYVGMQTHAAMTVGTATNWTNPGNIILNTSSPADCAGSCITNKNTLTINAPITAVYPGFTAGYNDVRFTWDDLKFYLQGCGDDATSANRVMQVALSLHPDLNEVDSNWITLPANTQCNPVGTVTAKDTQSGPPNYPAFSFADWTGGKGLFYTDLTQRTGTLTAAGGVVTWVSGAPFNINWKNGDKITIVDSSSACASNICTIVSVQSATKLTLLQALTTSGASFTQNGFGFLLRKNTTTGAMHLNNVTFDMAQSNPGSGMTSGAFRMYSPVSTTTTYDRAGTNDSVVRTGYCMVTAMGGSYNMYFFIPATGESRYLVGPSGLGNNPPTWSKTTACSYLSMDSSNNILSNTYNDTTYKEQGYNTGSGEAGCYAPISDKACNGSTSLITKTTVLSGTTVLSQVNTAYAAYTGGRYSYNASWYTPFTISSPGIGNVAQISSSFGTLQDNLAIVCFYGIAENAILSCMDTFSTTPSAYGGAHFGNPVGTDVAGNAGFIKLFTNPYAQPIPWAASGTPSNVLDIIGVPSRTNAPSATGYCNSNSGSDSAGDCAGSYATCPTNSYGATGNNCVQVTFANQPAIKDPTTNGANMLSAFPWCSSQAGRTGVWSFIKTLQAGDNLRNFTANHSQDDELLVLSVTGSSCDGSITVWLWHDWNGLVAHSREGTPPGWFSSANANMVDPSWAKLFAAPTGLTQWIQPSTGTVYTDSSPMGMAHNDYNQSGTGNSGTWVAGGGQYSVRTGVNPTIFSTFQTSNNFSPAFNGSTSANGSFQSHQSLAQQDTTLNPFVTDVKNLANDGGSNAVYTTTVTGPISPYANVYKVSISGILDRKNLPLFVRAGRFLLNDISGTAITDATTSSFCVAEYGNLCNISGAVTGDVYINSPYFTPDLTTCSAYDLDFGGPCAFVNPVHGLDVFQQALYVDPATQYYRRLSALLGGQGHQGGVANGLPNWDASWLQSSNLWAQGVISSFNLMVQLPPWLNGTTINNARYIPIPVKVNTGAGTKARVIFGYAENEPSGATSIHFYPTSRQEAGTTCTVGTDPFAFASETQTCPTVGGGTTINIPALSGHVLYYQIQRLDNSNTVLATGPIQVLALP